MNGESNFIPSRSELGAPYLEYHLPARLAEGVRQSVGLNNSSFGKYFNSPHRYPWLYVPRVAICESFICLQVQL